MRKYILVVPLLIAFLPCAAVLSVALGQWQWGIIFLLSTVILNWLTETFPVHIPGDRVRGTEDIRILTYNVNRAHKISVNKGTTQGFIRFILRQEADIVLLQEYNVGLYPEVRERLIREYPYEVGTDEGDKFKSVFSKYPIEDYEQLSVVADAPEYTLLQHGWYCKSRSGRNEVLPVCSMVVRIGEERLRIVNCHLMSNNYSVVIRNTRKKGKSLLRAVFPVMAKMDYGYAARKLQAEIVCQHLVSCKEDRVIVCGDFNDISGSTTLRSFMRLGLKSAWWKRGFGYGFTFHGMKMRLRLDHVLYSDRALRLQRVCVPHSECSDHDPVVCDFNLI